MMTESTTFLLFIFCFFLPKFEWLSKWITIVLLLPIFFDHFSHEVKGILNINIFFGTNLHELNFKSLC